MLSISLFQDRLMRLSKNQTLWSRVRSVVAPVIEVQWPGMELVQSLFVIPARKTSQAPRSEQSICTISIFCALKPGIQLSLQSESGQ